MNRYVSENLWETPEITHINMLPATSCLIPYDSEASAAEYDRSKSPYTRSLNGTWRFRLYSNPEAVTVDALTSATEPEGFRDMAVPSNWTLQDTGDYPIYTNVQMPFENDPPFVPEENPTGVYRTEFDLPDEWNTRRIVIHFGGVESYLELYVNDEFVGMAKDTRLPSEFDISRFVVSGVNRIAAKVIRWSDSSYIEDQDQWWMAGIYRNVYIYSTAKAHIEDIFARGDYDASTKVGQLNVDTHFAFSSVAGSDPIKNTGPTEQYTIDAKLLDDDKSVVWQATSLVDPSFRVHSYGNNFSASIAGASPWSTESPALYTLVVSLRDSAGNHIESRSVRVGFRNIRIENRELLINGKAVLIRGANRHEHDERTGKVISRELMETDIRLLKQFNFNAVRTSHYPDAMLWYDLCDEYGIYLIDEANIETHANYHTLCRDPRWKRAFEERMINMVKRDKNHPAVIAWSAGNESGHGENHLSAIDLVRKYDPSRIIHHEGEVKGNWQQRGNAYTGGENRYNDIVNPMYPPIEDVIAYATDARDPRPMILCEYSHAMGNSNGSLAEYWDAFETYHGLQGGFIWEWVDHGLVKTDESGREYWAYGGDFGEAIHDRNFVADGLVSPDRTPHPAMYEYKKVAQPIGVQSVSILEGRFSITNKRDFSALNDIDGSWEISTEGVVVDSGFLPPLDIPPGGSQEIRIGYRNEAILRKPETYVKISFAVREETCWCSAGHVIAWEQFRSNFAALPSPAAKNDPVSGISASNENDRLVISSGEIILETPTMSPESTCSVTTQPVSAVRFDSEVRLVQGPRLNLFRGTTDNDGIRDRPGEDEKPMVWWTNAGFHDLTLVERSAALVDENGIEEKCTYIGTDKNAAIDCGIYQRVVTPTLIRTDVRMDFPSSLPTLPRIGIILTLPAGYEELTWYGRGPQENHIDRKRGYPVGLYESTVSDQYVRYIMPQENGNKCEVRWFELSNGPRTTRFIADPQFEFSAHHFTPEDLFAARHTTDIENHLRNETIVSIDLVQRGVGTGSCGPQTRRQYCISPGSFTFGFWIEFSS